MIREKSLWIVVPAYNEEPQIAETIRHLEQRLPNVVVVDDGSADGTSNAAYAAKAKVVRHPINLGQGASLMTGIQFALRQGADWVVTFDADGQHDPADIDVLLDEQRRTNSDVVIGSRFIGQTIDMPASRRLLLKAATLYTRLTTGLSVTDSHNGLRLFTRRAATKLNIRQNRMAHASEILEWLSESGLRVSEAPVRIRYTSYSLAKGQTFFSSFNILWDMWSSRLHR